MNKKRQTMVMLACFCWLAFTTLLHAEIKSGLQIGDYADAFDVKDCSSAQTRGKTLCYRWVYGGRPVVAVFTRSLDDNVVSLAKELQAKLFENSNKQLRAFVVVLSDKPQKQEGKLSEIAQMNRLRTLPLTVFKDAKGPPDYKIAADAEVTVMLWTGLQVKANHAFAVGELNAAAIKKVIVSLGTILK